MSEFIDYRRQSRDDTRSEGRPKSRSSSRRGKAYEDYSKRDLEKEASENYNEPLGNYVKDSRVQQHEGNEESYIAGNAFGGGRAKQQEYAEKASPFDDRHQSDVGRAYSGIQDEGYYAAPKHDRPVSFRHEPEDYVPQFARDRARQGPQDLGYDPDDRNFVHPQPMPHFPTQNFFRKCVLTGFQIGSFIGTSAAFGLVVVMSIVWYIARRLNPFHKQPPPPYVTKEFEQRITGERLSNRAEYYAEYWGYQCESLEVETEDGFVLRLHHLISKKHKQPGHPVILQHGILSNSVTFMVNEERSLAFWLMEQGYDVWLSNIRTNYKMPHRHFPRSDPRYWTWSIEQIGCYDLPAIVDHVVNKTGKRPAYVGHSQGTGTMFLALSRGIRPDLGNKLSCFIALSPAVYGGPVLRSFPFSLMRRFRNRKIWSLIFGVREFMPIISITQALLPSWLFGHIASPVFCFLFGFHTTRWLNRQIPKYFRSVAVANSSELLYYYMSNLSYNNCIFDTTTSEPWFPRSFPPLAIIYGTQDFLVLGKPLVERIRTSEPNVKLLKVVAIEGAEHQDPIWARDAVETSFGAIKDVIEETRDR